MPATRFPSLCCLLLTLFVCSAQAQTPPDAGVLPRPATATSPLGSVEIEPIEVPGGLAIVQDQRGVLWIAGTEGLYRYDGIDYTLYQHGPQDSTSLSSSRFETLHIDSDGTLWVGTFGGLNRYDEATDINQLVSEHIDLAYHGKRAQMPDLTVEINRDLDEEVGSVEVVPQEIGRVLLNLLGNAFDAVYEHAVEVNGAYAPTVTVSTRRLDNGVEIRVQDNGPGIPKNLLEKIFEPFLPSVSRLRLVSRRSRRDRGRGWA